MALVMALLEQISFLGSDHRPLQMTRIGSSWVTLIFIAHWRTEINWGGNVLDTLIFNDVIGHLGLVELPLKGRAYTWSSMQQDPLLKQLDWFFTSVIWTLPFQNTLVLPLARITSDHIPCKVVIGTSIPKINIFRFENFLA